MDVNNNIIEFKEVAMINQFKMITAKMLTLMNTVDKYDSDA